jgi:hypothetical protein
MDTYIQRKVLEFWIQFLTKNLMAMTTYGIRMYLSLTCLSADLPGILEQIAWLVAHEWLLWPME